MMLALSAKAKAKWAYELKVEPRRNAAEASALLSILANVAGHNCSPRMEDIFLLFLSSDHALEPGIIEPERYGALSGSGPDLYRVWHRPRCSAVSSLRI